MRKTNLTALAVIAVLAVGAGMAVATMGDYNYDRTIFSQQYVASGADPGPCCACTAPVCAPACPGCAPVANGHLLSDCCNVAPANCGALCAAGQTAVGWPYNWCSEHWLRPDSNF